MQTYTKHIPKLTHVYITYANMKLPKIYQINIIMPL